MSAHRSPSATPTPRTAPLPDPTSPSPPHAPASPRRARSPLRPFGSSPKIFESLLLSSPRKKSPRSLPEQHDSLPDPVEGPSEVLSPLAMDMVDADAVITLPDIRGENEGEEKMASTFRERSRPPSRASDDHQITQKAEMSDSKLASSWWGPEKHVPRPWYSKQRTMPKEHEVAHEETRKAVARAVVSVLGTTTDLIHETLIVGVDLFEFVPIPGLALAARIVLNIWDAAQYADMNQLACFRLTERCADILLSVRQEVNEAGDRVGKELASPIKKLEESYSEVYRFMLKRQNQPWLKRYLKRDEILRDIEACGSMLRDALTLFGVSIQIRILRQVQETEQKREFASMAVLKAIRDNQIPVNSELRIVMESEIEVASPEPSPSSAIKFATESVTDFVTHRDVLKLLEGELVTPESLHPSEIIPALATLHTAQNNIDAVRDTNELRQLLRSALATQTDKDMLDVLGIARQEMPDAIKALQREHERVVERNGENLASSTQSDILSGTIRRRTMSVQEERPGRQGSVTLQRSQTTVSIDSSSSSGLSGSSFGRRDTLDQEFLEMGIDCLTRMTGAQATVPNWTITKFEIDKGEKIGFGFFSDVFKGSWNGRTVAIKILAETTPRKLFLREVAIWKTLHHPNVLPLYGACSTTGEPPWFLVSPFIKNGNLVDHLKRVEQEYRPSGLGVGRNADQPVMHHSARSAGYRANSLPGPLVATPQSLALLYSSSFHGASLTPPGTTARLPGHDNGLSREWDLFRFMHEIAKGMEYLHNNGVLHGDLKGLNVLVDYKHRCLISDFGQSEMKSEAFRMSGTPPHVGTLRWQAPEFMSGQNPEMTPAVDVWAFAITCSEILTMGRVPWPLMDDVAVRYFVLKEDTRPPLPKNSRFLTPRILELLSFCWHTDPSKRYTFSKIAKELKLLRKSYGQDLTESPRPVAEDLPDSHLTSTPSPDMRPRELLPQYSQGSGPMPPPDVLGESFPSLSAAPRPDTEDEPHQESTIADSVIKMPEPVFYTPASSRSSTMRVHRSVDHVPPVPPIPVYDGYESPPPTDKLAAQRRTGGRYRMLLMHNFHPSLVLPLWDPTPVDIGAVGYLSKVDGGFVTFFNAFNPARSEHPGIRLLPSVHGYGTVKDGIQYQAQKSVAQKAIDMLIGSLAFRNKSEDLIRRTSFPLKAGHPAAYLYAENAEYRYFETLDAPKKWFQSHAEAIIRIYGYQAKINKEDLFFIIGTLRTAKYGLMFSHQHPEGHAHFNVYSSPKPGRPWGTFTMDDEVPRALGPEYEFDDPEDRARYSESKVSDYNGPSNAVLLARLRFKTDSTECTSR